MFKFKAFAFSLLFSLTWHPSMVSAEESLAEEQAEQPEERLVLRAAGGNTLEGIAAKPLNLARNSMVGDSQLYRMGADQPQPDIQAQDALIGADKAQSAELGVGENQFMLDLNGFFNVNRFAFRSYSASGRFIIQGSETELSMDSRRWQNLTNPEAFRPGENVELEFPYSSVRYVRIRFEADVPGDISPFTLSGDDTVLQLNPLFLQSLDGLDFSYVSAANMVPFNFASSIAGTQVSLISSGNPDAANSILDDDVSTYFEFEPSDPENVLILDLRNPYRVSKFSMVFDAGPGTLQIYNLTEMPQPEVESDDFDPLNSGYGSESRMSISKSYFEQNNPIFQRSFDAPADRVQIDFPETELRYVVLRWIPAASDPDAPVALTDAAPTASAQFRSLRIYEVSLIGQVPKQFAAMGFIPRAQFLAQNPEMAALIPRPGNPTQPQPALSQTPDVPPPPLPTLRPISR